MESISSFTAFVTLDYIVLFSTWIIVSFLALRGLNTYLYALLLAIPMSLVVYQYATEARWVGESIASLVAQPTGALALLGGLVAAFGVAIFRLINLWGGEPGGLFQAAVFGAAYTAALLTFWQIAPNTATLWDFSAHIDTIFNASYALWLLVGSFAVMTLFRR